MGKLRYEAEWWNPDIPPEAAVDVFASAAVVNILIAVLIEERLATGELTEEDMVAALREAGAEVVKKGGGD